MPEIKQNAYIAAHTENEIRVIDYLFKHFDEDINIRKLAVILKISPPGAMKILKKLKAKGVLFSKKIGLADFYMVNLHDDKTANLVKYILEFNIYNNTLMPYLNELEILKEKTKMCLIFGSILSNTRKANDIDIIIIINEKDYKTIRNNIRKIESHLGKKVHPVMQTESDLIKNIGKKDKVILNAIKTGLFLWGSEYIIKGVKQWECMKTS